MRLSTILPKERPFLIAEAGVNHNGRVAMALRLVDAAAAAGADAVKFQTFRAAELAAAGAPRAAYQRRSGNSSQREMLARLELPPTAHRTILARCRARRIMFLSTPFDGQSADFLDDLGMALFKIPSGEITNHALLAHIARKGKPIILSTGMCTLDEVRAAVSVLRKAGARELVLLHCVSSYPTAPRDANLRAMATLSKALKLPVGYSDHTLGTEVAVASAALGAAVIEKHFTLDKRLPGPDHAMSLSPSELRSLAAQIRNAAAALGDGVKRPRPCELEVMSAARRSIVLARDASAGQKLAAGDLAFKRPGTGIPPFELNRVVGRTLRRTARAESLLRWEMLA